MQLFVNYRILRDHYLCQSLHNNIKQCAFVQLGRENILTMGCSNLVQGRLGLHINMH